MSADAFPDTPGGMFPFHSGPEQEAEAAAIRKVILKALGYRQVYELTQAWKAGQAQKVMALIEEGHRLADISPDPAISRAAALISGSVKLIENGDPLMYVNEALNDVEEHSRVAFVRGSKIVETHVKGKIIRDKDRGIIYTEAGAVVVVRGPEYDFRQTMEPLKKYGYKGVVVYGEELDERDADILRTKSYKVARTEAEFIPFAKGLCPTFGDKVRGIIDGASDRFEPVKKITDFSKATQEAWEMIPEGLKKPAYMGMKAGSALLAGAMGAYLAAHHPDLKQIVPPLIPQAIAHPQIPRDGVPGLLGSVKKSSRANPPASLMRRGIA